MRKNYFVWILLFFMPLSSINAQQEKIDSLMQVLQKHTKESNAKVDLLNEITNAYYIFYTETNNDSLKLKYAFEYAKAALELGEKLHYESGMAIANNRIGVMNLLSGDYYGAYVFLKKAEKQFEALQDSINLCNIYNNILYVLDELGDIEEIRAISYNFFDFGMKIIPQLSDPKSKKEVIEILGYVVTYYNLSSPTLGYIPPDEKETEVLNFLMDNADQLSPFSVFFIERRYAQMLAWQKQEEQALKYARIASGHAHLAEITEMGWKSFVLSEIHSILGNSDSAQYYLDKTFEVYEYEPYMEFLIEHTSMIIDSLRGDWRGAFEHYSNFVAMENTLRQGAKTSEIIRVKNWSEIERHESEKQILIQEKQQQKQLFNLSLILLVLVLVLAVLLIIYSRKRITDNKLLQKANKELHELHKVKDKLFSLIAHDLRNPMSTFLSLLQLLSVSKLEDGEKEGILKAISYQANETFSLLNNLLFWSKSQMNGINPCPQFFDIGKRSCDTFSQLEQHADSKNVTLKNYIPEQQIFADPDMIDVIIRNLVTNAIKYSHRNSEVTLAGEVKGDYIEISVRDSGIGIPDDIQQTLFIMTETNSRRGTINEEGSGLGLVLCAEFAHLNNGTIRFESKQGEGSVFYFTVPTKGLKVDNS